MDARLAQQLSLTHLHEQLVAAAQFPRTESEAAAATGELRLSFPTLAVAAPTQSSPTVVVSPPPIVKISPPMGPEASPQRPEGADDEEVEEYSESDDEDGTKYWMISDCDFENAIAAQRELGPQSCRGTTRKAVMATVAQTITDGHSVKCFQQMLYREHEHAGQFVVFYHSYNSSVLLYECQSVIAQTLFGLPEDFAPLPRLLKGSFAGKPHLKQLPRQDIRPRYIKQARSSARTARLQPQRNGVISAR